MMYDRIFYHGFKFHDLTMLCLSISDIAIITVNGVDYCCINHDISKSEAINLLKNPKLEDRGIYKYAYQRNQY